MTLARYLKAEIWVIEKGRRKVSHVGILGNGFFFSCCESLCGNDMCCDSASL